MTFQGHPPLSHLAAKLRSLALALIALLAAVTACCCKACVQRFALARALGLARLMLDATSAGFAFDGHWLGGDKKIGMPEASFVVGTRRGPSSPPLYPSRDMVSSPVQAAQEARAAAAR